MLQNSAESEKFSRVSNFSVVIKHVNIVETLIMIEAIKNVVSIVNKYDECFVFVNFLLFLTYTCEKQSNIIQ